MNITRELNNSQAFDRACALTQEIMSMARGQIIMQLRFMDRALFEMRPVLCDQGEIRTDGARMYYSPGHILEKYRENRHWVLHAYLHALMHSVFRHAFVSPEIYGDMWDIACDIAVEKLIRELDMPFLSDDPLRARREALLDRLYPDAAPSIAEKLYSAIMDMPPESDEERAIAELLRFDDHSLWYSADGGGDGSDGDSRGGDAVITTLSGIEVLRLDAVRRRGDISTAELWEDISRQIEIDLENFNAYGDQPGSMVQALRALNREKYDYAEFLNKFAERAEVMRISPDEFDYVFYSFGMELYGDTPLIEPLEYRDDNRIRELVIAIDTSGSVAGEVVQRFMQKTYNILKSHETFDRRFFLHIIQCDAKIQQDALITTQDEFDAWLDGMELRGFGGTDFRPVFEYVDRLRAKGELRRMKGLIYFTDGVGKYPEKQPDYMTAFAFVQKELGAVINVPPWAIKLVLDDEQLR